MLFAWLRVKEISQSNRQFTQRY